MKRANYYYAAYFLSILPRIILLTRPVLRNSFHLPGQFGPLHGIDPVVHPAWGESSIDVSGVRCPALEVTHSWPYE